MTTRSHALLVAGVIRETDTPPDWVVDYVQERLTECYHSGRRDGVRDAADSWDELIRTPRWLQVLRGRREERVSIWLRRQTRPADEPAPSVWEEDA